MADSFRSGKSLTEREIERIYTRILEFDLEAAIYNRAFLADELVQTRLSNFAGSVGSYVNTMVIA